MPVKPVWLPVSYRPVDVRYFLKQRLEFISQLYEHASYPFVERKRSIEAEEAPFTPYYDECGEPPYLDEWLEAEESLQVLGRSCISMLASALHVYLMTWQQLTRVPIDDNLRPIFKRKGWLQGYKAHFERHSRVPFHKCPVSLELLEELVLARNRVQHPDSITTDSSAYSKADLQKLSRPFFVDERDLDRMPDLTLDERWLLLPSIKVTADKLQAAIRAVEQFADWFETVEADSVVKVDG